MNKQEAIESITDLKNDTIKDNILNQALCMAISALEKQISKKPTDTWEKDIERQRHHLCKWACPDCGTFLGFENKHCTECGTKIKWDVIA